MRRPILTLTTDFGLHGSYVAEMKGIVLSALPETVIVDVCHTITPQNVAEGAFVLERLADCFPNGTVHLAVIDPGVGTSRGLVAAEAAGQWWLAPDNGLLQGLLRERPPSRVVAIENPALWRSSVATTFHGRDILAPAAVHLLRGGAATELGADVEAARLVPLADLEPITLPNGFQGRVRFVDSFGNLITNIKKELLDSYSGWIVSAGGRTVRGMVSTYADNQNGDLISLIGSTGYLEIAVVNGGASRVLGVGVGATVTCVREVTT